MALQLHFRGKTPLRVNLAGLVTPTWTSTHSLAEIERRPVIALNELLPLAELFAVSGDPSDMQIEFHGEMPNVSSIGGMVSEGTVRVEGFVGRQAGGGMRGGELIINGHAGDWLGCCMRGGRIRILGDAGHFVAAALPGERRGMTGGEIFIDGAAGDYVGVRMRRGLIAVGGDAGDSIGRDMLAGTILVFGHSGPRPGIGMRRGTIGLFAGAVELPLTFRRANRSRPLFMQLLLTHLRRQGVHAADMCATSEYLAYHGDMLALGKGEILLKVEV